MSNSANNDVNENYIQTNYGCVDKVFNEDNLEEYRERYNENLDNLWNDLDINKGNYFDYVDYDYLLPIDNHNDIDRMKSELTNKNVVMCSYLKFLSKEVSNNFDKIMKRIDKLEEKMYKLDKRMDVLEESISSS